jgi:malate dehydrogenase (oxaloacetate-decarboxylating)
MSWDRPPRAFRLRIRVRGPAVLGQPDTQPRYRVHPRGTEEAEPGGTAADRTDTFEGQLRRVYAQYKRQPDDLSKNVFLTNMRDGDPR